MKAILFKADNYYLYSIAKNQFLLLSPILYDIIEKFQHGIEKPEIEYSVRINYKNINEERIQYYFEKYELLKESGYFDSCNLEKRICGRYSEKSIEIGFTNTSLIIFEVTDKCNLKCKYCTYGEFYNNYDPRENKNLDFSIAKNVLDSYLLKRESNLNKTFNKKTRINFYGGEPLLNMALIKRIIDYINEKGLGSYFDYGMTTNGTLLHKHIEFLVCNNFELVVSIDGNKDCHSLRPFKNGESSFKVLTDNLNNIKNDYPDYFEKQVKFNSVYHKKSNIDGVINYLKKTYNKIPMLAPLDDNGIIPERREEFKDMYKTVKEDLEEAQQSTINYEDAKLHDPYNDRLRKIFLNSIYSDTLPRLLSRDFVPKMPTGTCAPFSRSVYVTVNGNLFLCERIGHENCLGNLKSREIDFKNIANTLNQKYDLIRNQCKSCYMMHWCDQCIMVLDTINGKITCPDFKGANDIKDYLSRMFIFFEKNTEIYFDTMINF